ncbi:MAG: hypothetical protein JSS82_00130, partial [Bacteroidetes bacterium]|nr:hypothetical protein [Bacteroidota bacterium]
MLTALKSPSCSALSFGYPMDFKDNMHVHDGAFSDIYVKTPQIDSPPAAPQIPYALKQIKAAYSMMMTHSSSHTTGSVRKLFSRDHVASLGSSNLNSTGLSLTYAVSGDVMNRIKDVMMIRNAGHPDLWIDDSVSPYPGFLTFVRSVLFGSVEQLQQAVLWLSERMYTEPKSSTSSLKLLPVNHPAFGFYRSLVFFALAFKDDQEMFDSMQVIYNRPDMLKNTSELQRKRRMGYKSSTTVSSYSSKKTDAATSENRSQFYNDYDVQSNVSCEAPEGLAQLDSEELLERETGMHFSINYDLSEPSESVAQLSHLDLTEENLQRSKEALFRLAAEVDRLEPRADYSSVRYVEELCKQSERRAMYFSKIIRNAYMGMRPLLDPYKYVFANIGMLETVWKALLYSEALWIDHYPLVALLMEMIDFGYEKSVYSGSLIPYWKLWFFYRKKYIQYCMALHKRDHPPSPLNMEDQPWCNDAETCKYCRLVSMNNLTEPDAFLGHTRHTHWNCDRYGRRTTQTLSELHGKLKGIPFMEWCILPGGDEDILDIRPLCNIPPIPDSPTVMEWEEVTFKIKGEYSLNSHNMGEVSEAVVPQTVGMFPDCPVPAHYLFYLFAFDPRVKTDLRQRIVMGLRNTDIMPNISPCANPKIGNAAQTFLSGCNRLNEYVHAIYPVQSESQDHSCRYGLSDYNDWIDAGCPAFTMESVNTHKLPAHMLMHLGFVAEAFSNLPYTDTELASMVKPTGDVCYGRGVLRSMVTNQCLRDLYDPELCLKLACDMSRSIPLGYQARSLSGSSDACATFRAEQLTPDGLEIAKNSNVLCTYEVQDLCPVQCIPVWKTPIVIVGDYNVLDRGCNYMFQADSVVHRSYFATPMKVPLPFSNSQPFIFHETINHPMVYYDMNVIHSFVDSVVVHRAEEKRKKDIRVSGEDMQVMDHLQHQYEQ